LSKRKLEELAVIVDAIFSEPSVKLDFGGPAVEYLLLESHYIGRGDPSSLRDFPSPVLCGTCGYADFHGTRIRRVD